MDDSIIESVPPGYVGIYRITLVRDGRCYIGSTVDIRRRWGEHRKSLRAGTHHSKYMQRCYTKYGENALIFEILEICDITDMTDEQVSGLLFVREQCWFDLKTPEFNSAPIAGSMLGFKHSEETRAKISAAKTGTDYWTGRKHAQESKDKMSLAKQGNTNALGHTLSPETKAKLSEDKKGNQNRLGKRHTDETKEKIRTKALARSAERRERETPASNDNTDLL